MTLLNITKYALGIAAIVFIFIDWRIAVILFLVGSIFHVIPLGPNPLLGIITGYLIIGGLAYLFFDWRIGVGLIIAGFLVTKFRIWGNKKNYEYYHKEKEVDEKTKQ